MRTPMTVEQNAVNKSPYCDQSIRTLPIRYAPKAPGNIKEK